MALETFTYPGPPTSTNENEGTDYHLGLRFTVPSDVPCIGVDIRWADTLIAPPGGAYRVALWQLNPDSRLKFVDPTPTPGLIQRILWDAPVILSSLEEYQVDYFTRVFAFRSGGFPLTTPSGLANADTGRVGASTNPDVRAASNSGLIFYITPIFGTEDSGYTPVTSTLTSKWRIYGGVTSGLTSKWRIYGRVTSSLTSKWRIFQGVTSSLTSKWRVLGGVVSTLTSKWRVYERVTSILRAKWRIEGDTPPPVVSSRYLETQRRMTAAFIADDPTTAELTPRNRVSTPSGGFQVVDGDKRQPQTFKLSLLAYDQRPTVTVAGVERIMDFHLIGLWDMDIAVGDQWTDEAGTTYEVAALSEGWDYMTKAMVFRHIPRGANP
jgi:hypothetical protein